MPEESIEQGILRIIEPIRRTVMLDDSREAFCRFIVSREGIEKSYNKAYGVTLSADDANNMALLLLENNEVILRVNQLERERMTYRNLTKESMIVGLKDIFDVSLADYFDEGMTEMKDSSNWTQPMRMAAKKVEFGKFGVKFEIADKMAIADKIMGMMQFSQPVLRESVDTGLSKYTDAELAAMAGVEVGYEEVKSKKRNDQR